MLYKWSQGFDLLFLRRIANKIRGSADPGTSAPACGAPPGSPSKGFARLGTREACMGFTPFFTFLDVEQRVLGDFLKFSIQVYRVHIVVQRHASDSVARFLEKLVRRKTISLVK